LLAKWVYRLVYNKVFKKNYDFAYNNSQEGMKQHQMRGETQAQINKQTGHDFTWKDSSSVTFAIFTLQKYLRAKKKEEGKHYGKLKKIFHQAKKKKKSSKNPLHTRNPPKILQDIYYNSITINLKFQTQVKKINNHLSKILI